MTNVYEGGGKHRKESRFESYKDSAKRAIGVGAVAAACIIPVYELSSSDLLMAKIYNGISDEIHDHESFLHIHGEAEEKLVEDAAIMLTIEAEVLVTGLMITKNKPLREVFEYSDEYSAEQAEKREKSRLRRYGNAVLTSPYWMFGKVGSGIKKAGAYLDKKDSKILAPVGKELIDLGAVNAMGTNGVVMSETVDGRPTPTKRIAKLGAYIAGSWVLIAEPIRLANQEFPDTFGKYAHEFGAAFTEATSFTNPVGATLMGAAVTGLTISAVNRKRFANRRKREDAEHAAEPEMAMFFDETTEMPIINAEDINTAVAALNAKTELA